jgi:7-dehydrocholesterol reductase
MQVFRATNGKALVWGKPPQMIAAKYSTGDGKQKTSLLLASGNKPTCTSLAPLGHTQE